jgi:hypothetical protein
LEIDLDITVEVEYEVVDNPPPERHYPIDILTAKFRGKDILSLLHIGHIMTLQRRVYHRLLDEADIDVIPTKLGDLECK